MKRISHSLGVHEFDFDIDKKGGSKIVYLFTPEEKGKKSLRFVKITKENREIIELKRPIDCLYPKIRVICTYYLLQLFRKAFHLF